MLIQTGRGSISLVAGCCWVHSVQQPPPGRHRDRNNDPLPAAILTSRKESNDSLKSEADRVDSPHHAP